MTILLLLAGGGLACACGSTTPSPTRAASTPPPTSPSASGAVTTTSGASSESPQAEADHVAEGAGCPANPSTALTKPHWSRPPAMAIDTTTTYSATVTTDVGSFVIALDVGQAPLTVNNFVFLADQGFYNCVIFHRVIPGFMDQTGDPTGTGAGGPGYTFADELPKRASPQYPVGSVAMANAGPNTNGSQFFIVTGAEGENLPPDYTIFGSVTSGMAVVDRINADGNADAASNGVPPKVIHRMLKVTVAS